QQPVLNERAAVSPPFRLSAVPPTVRPIAPSSHHRHRSRHPYRREAGRRLRSPRARGPRGASNACDSGSETRAELAAHEAWSQRPPPLLVISAQRGFTGQNRYRIARLSLVLLQTAWRSTAAFEPLLGGVGASIDGTRRRELKPSGRGSFA